MARGIKGLPQIYSLSEYNIPPKILVVGCGGTGGHLIPHLARMIGVMRHNSHTTELILADGDVVEEKNLVRQNFVGADLGKNKAVVMAARYSRAFGYEIIAFTEDLESRKAIIDLIGAGTAMVVGCVDNNASRRVINEWFSQSNIYCDRFWIDSGNEESAGQVILGYNPPVNRPFGSRAAALFSTPTVLEVFPEMQEDGGSFNSQLSCAERAQSAPQNMQTNVTAATITMNYIQKILRREPLKSHGVDFSIENVFSTRLNTKENLEKVNPNRKKEWERSL